ncbi:MAG: phosphoglycerate kinase [Pseudomonadota bacterium]
MTIIQFDKLPLAGKKIFCRVDFNVPLDDRQRVGDDTRIQAALPTIKHILNAGGFLICASHLGRPKGKPTPELKMEPVGVRLAELLGSDHRVLVTDEATGDGVRKVVMDMEQSDVVLLENLRFHPGEKKNDETFAKDLASLAEIYVNDAFGSAHRAHASTFGMVSHFKRKGAGFLMMKEVEALSQLLGNVRRPYCAVLGGAKVSDKIGVLESLLERVDVLLIGGAMANTFIKANGGEVGNSFVEDEKLDLAKHILERAKKKGTEVLLPSDVVVASGIDSTTSGIVQANKVPSGHMALDIGPKTQKDFGEKILVAHTIFWSGPMGVFEKPLFASGTLAVARAVAEAKGMSVVGGGDSVSAVKKSGVADRIGHISTGGGASLEFIEGKKLPGIEALEA